MKQIGVLAVFFLATPVFLAAQNVYIDSLLTQIAGFQKTHTDSNYSSGMFPSQRFYLPQKEKIKEDDNIFFTGLIVWTLNAIKTRLSAENQIKIKSIFEKATENYDRYKNKNGRPTYNFWQTNPSRHFPNSAFFSRKKKFILPDDLDDTSVIYLSGNFSDSLKRIVHLLMAQHANGNKKTIRNTFKKYKKVPAYSTWFGENMPIDFDICVQANALMFVLNNHLNLNRNDSATIRVVKDMVHTGKYIKRSHYASPHYQDPCIVLYHLARLVAAHPEQKELASLKQQLVKDLYSEWEMADNSMQQILLQTSLIRLGEQLPQKIQVTPEDRSNFYFFVANMTSVFPNPIKGIFIKSRRTNFFYNCEPYYLTLLLENEVLRGQQNL